MLAVVTVGIYYYLGSARHAAYVDGLFSDQSAEDTLYIDSVDFVDGDGVDDGAVGNGQ